jgi:hypothetical protein
MLDKMSLKLETKAKRKPPATKSAAQTYNKSAAATCNQSVATTSNLEQFKSYFSYDINE